MRAVFEKQMQRWRVRRAARRAFERSLGFARERWPLTPAADCLDSGMIIDWYRTQLARTATPYGVSDCGVIVRLIALRPRRAILWEYAPPMTERAQLGPLLAELADLLRALPLAHFPEATHLEAHLVSMGDILRQAMGCRSGSVRL